MSCFTFNSHPFYFPPPPSCFHHPGGSSPPLIPGEGTAPTLLQAKAAPPAWEGLCTLPYPLPLRPGAIFESAPRTEKGWGRAGPPGCSALRLSTQGRDREKADPPSNTDLCLARAHPGSSFRNKIPVPLPWYSKPGTPGQQGQRMLTKSATPFPTTPGVTAGERVASQNSPRTRGLYQPGPTPAPIQVA